MDNYPGVSIIIPCLNESRTMPFLLDALKQQRYPGEMQVVIVDNGSTDGTQEIVRSYDYMLLHEKYKSSYLARNRGLLHSRYDWIAFLDGDCIPDKYWLINLVQCAIFKHADYVAGHIHFTTDHNTLANELLAYRRSHDIQKENVKRYACVAGGNMLIGRHVFDRLGKFMPVISGGDIEFSKRAFASGFRLAYADKATVSHQSDFTNFSYLKRPFRIRYGQEVTNPSRTPFRHLFHRILEFPWRPGFRAVRPVAEALHILGMKRFNLWTYLWLERLSDYLGAVFGSLTVVLKQNKSE